MSSIPPSGQPPSTVAPHANGDVQPLSDRLSFPQAQAETASTVETKRTTGERWFDRITYGGIAGVATFGLSVGAMYLMQYGSGKALFGLSNKSWKDAWSSLVDRFTHASIWQSIADSPLGRTKLFSFVHNPERLQRTGTRMLETLALGAGGTAMVVPIEMMESRKKSIVHSLNEKFGTAEEVAHGDQRVQDEAPQTFGSIIQGRTTAYLTVLFSLLSIDALITRAASRMQNAESSPFMKDMASKGLNAVSEKAGTFFENKYTAFASSVTEKGKLFWNRIGSISTLDAVATAAAASLLYTSSKIYSKARQRKTDLKAAALSGGTAAAAEAPATVESAEHHPAATVISRTEAEEKEISHTDRVQARASHSAEAAKAPASGWEHAR